MSGDGPPETNRGLNKYKKGTEHSNIVVDVKIQKATFLF